MFGASIGKTLLYGTVVAIPAIVIAGPLFARTIKKIKATPLPEFYNPVVLKDHEMPKMGISVFTALLPVLLIGLSTLLDYALPGEFPGRKLLIFIGNPVMAMFDQADEEEWSGTRYRFFTLNDVLSEANQIVVILNTVGLVK